MFLFQRKKEKETSKIYYFWQMKTVCIYSFPPASNTHPHHPTPTSFSLLLSRGLNPRCVLSFEVRTEPPLCSECFLQDLFVTIHRPVQLVTKKQALISTGQSGKTPLNKLSLFLLCYHTPHLPVFIFIKDLCDCP